MKKIISSLERGGHAACKLGDKVVVTPFGGRILGLFPVPEKNVLWSDLLFLSDPVAFFAQDGWLNIGGDRTWIAPEIETHGDPNKSGYEVPFTVDPGSYKVVSSSADNVVMENTMAPQFRIIGAKASLKLTKTVSLLTAPKVALSSAVACAGYAVDLSLTAESPLPAGVKPETWNLLQVPGGGEVHLPVKRKTNPRRFIGKPVFESTENEVTARVETDDSFKFCIHADDSRGLMFCLNTADPADASLVMRKFDVQQADLYSDVPGDGVDEPGYIQQIYIDNGALGGFGEMEYHAPYICDARPVVKDHSEVWGFTGPADELEILMRELSRR